MSSLDNLNHKSFPHSERWHCRKEVLGVLSAILRHQMLRHQAASDIRMQAVALVRAHPPHWDGRLTCVTNALPPPCVPPAPASSIHLCDLFSLCIGDQLWHHQNLWRQRGWRGWGAGAEMVEKW